MRINAIHSWAAAAIFTVTVGVYSVRGQSHPGSQATPLPPGATRCDLSIPLSVEMLPLNKPSVGESARFQVVAQTTLDPDLVHRSWIEYSVRRKGAPLQEAVEQRAGLGRGREDRLEIGVRISDNSRHEVRARYVVELKAGARIAQTAVRWVNLTGEDIPEGMIGRIVDPDGTGIRVYRGTTVRN